MITALRIALATAVVCACTATHAADYPTRPVRMLVGFTPGGTSDVVARIISKKLTDAWGQEFVVDNRAGAAGMLAVELTARAAPDGHTLIFISSTFSMLPSSTPKLPYDPLRDFTPVSLTVASPYIVVVHPAVEARSIKELSHWPKPNRARCRAPPPGRAARYTSPLNSSTPWRASIFCWCLIKAWWASPI